MMKRAFIICMLICLYVMPSAAEVKSSRTVDDDGVIHVNITGDSPRKSVAPKAKSPSSTSSTPSFQSELDDICANVPKTNDPRPDLIFQGYMERSEGLKPVIETEIASAPYKIESLRILAACKDLYRLELSKRKQRRGYEAQMESLQRRQGK